MSLRNNRAVVIQMQFCTKDLSRYWQTARDVAIRLKRRYLSSRAFCWFDVCFWEMLLWIWRKCADCPLQGNQPWPWCWQTDHSLLVCRTPLMSHLWLKKERKPNQPNEKSFEIIWREKINGIILLSLWGTASGRVNILLRSWEGCLFCSRKKKLRDPNNPFFTSYRSKFKAQRHWTIISRNQDAV